MSNGKIVLDDSAVEFLQEEVGGEGTEVIANPPLVGDEANLTGLEVDGVKYAVPQGGGATLYKHTIRYTADNARVLTDILTTNSTPFTRETFITYMINNCPEIFGNGYIISAYGYVISAESSNIIISSMTYSGRVDGFDDGMGHSFDFGTDIVTQA